MTDSASDRPDDGGDASRRTAPGFEAPGVAGGYGRDFGGGGRNQGFDGAWGQGYGAGAGPSDYRRDDGGDAYGGGVSGADYDLSFGGRGDDMSGDSTWLRGNPRDAIDTAAGPFGGVGPGGWRRSDERLHEQVCEALSDDPRLDAREVEVEAAGGRVTLRGAVESRTDAALAEQIARRTPGVEDVASELSVRSR